MFNFTIQIDGYNVPNGEEVLAAIAKCFKTEAEGEKFQMNYSKTEAGFGCDGSGYPERS